MNKYTEYLFEDNNNVGIDVDGDGDDDLSEIFKYNIDIFKNKLNLDIKLFNTDNLENINFKNEVKYIFLMIMMIKITL